MKLRESSYFLMIIMAVMIAVIITSLGMEALKSKLLPIIIGSLVFILAAIALSGEISATYKSGTTGTRGEKTELAWHDYLWPGAWTLCFFLGAYLLGFMVAIPFFIFSYMKTHSLSWATSIVFAILTPTFLYAIFKLALGVSFYPGLIFN